MKKYVLALTLPLFTTNIYSQIHTKGTIRDENRRESVAYANTSLLQTDSTWLTASLCCAVGRPERKTPAGLPPVWSGKRGMADKE